MGNDYLEKAYSVPQERVWSESCTECELFVNVQLSNDKISHRFHMKI